MSKKPNIKREDLKGAHKHIKFNNDGAAEFLQGHALNGLEDIFPVTSALVKALAEKVRSGDITEADADEQAMQSFDSEFTAGLRAAE